MTDAEAARRADEATTQAFLNCYLRETGDYEVVSAADEPSVSADGELVRATLPAQGVELLAPLAHRSPTGRHLFAFPVYYRVGGAGASPLRLDAATLAALATKELALAGGAGDGDRAERSQRKSEISASPETQRVSEDSTSGRESRIPGGVRDELLERVLRSERNTAAFVAARRDDGERLYGPEFTFREAEQSLVFGHHLHPTPKSRRGIADRNRPDYAPELRGSFPLHYFRADPALVSRASALDVSAAEWVKDELRADESVPASFVAEHVESDDVLLPVHPWQADYLRDQFRVRARLGGDLSYLGPVGREFAPTTSVRTLYARDAPFMVKSSLNVRITNSVRANKRPELERGVAVAELLDTAFGDELADAFPAFEIVRDPAYLALDVGSERESGLETVLRANPFRGDDAARATPVVALCQDAVEGASRLGRTIRRIADREGRETGDVSEEWFRRYLEISVRPALWLYLERGVGVEAHQQNGVVTLDDDGYPETFHYRDNQGFYFPESVYDEVDAYLPGVGERADTVCADAVADERLRYYLVLNNAFGVVNAFGSAGVADERRLLRILREELERARRRYDRPSSSLLDPLLEEATVPCKANLLTRFRGLDELENELENQSVYADVPNPLVTDLEVTRT